MSPDQFLVLCEEVKEKWKMPRSGGQRIQKRTHSIEACMFAVIGSLCTGNDDLTMEGVVQMSDTFICREIERLLFILDEILDPLELLDDEQKELVKGTCKSNRGIIYFIDGCDFAVEEEKERWMYLTHKDNVKKRTAIRCQILVDSLWGFFRGVEVTHAGTSNDQKKLKNSVWNKPGVLTTGDECIGADGGYFPTQHINVSKPFTATELLSGGDTLADWNKTFNADREVIERSFGFLKKKFHIFAQPWRRNKLLFPVALRVALKLCNRFWRECENMPLGLKKQYNALHTI